MPKNPKPGEERVNGPRLDPYEPGAPDTADGALVRLMAIQKGLETEIARLEHSKQLYLGKIESAAMGRLPPPALQRSNIQLAPEQIHGYILSDYSILNVQHGGCMYVARSEDIRHPFKIAVTMKDGAVSEIDLIIPHTSPLLEIDVVLNKLSEKLCPHGVLLAVQQFIHMSKFRKGVIDSLSPNHFNHTFAPQRPQVGSRHSSVCCIWARHMPSEDVILELEWKFKWNEADHALAHSFFVRRASENMQASSFLQEFDNMSYSHGKEDSLLRLWLDFSHWVQYFGTVDARRN